MVLHLHAEAFPMSTVTTVDDDAYEAVEFDSNITHEYVATLTII
jgi:hypothetical protein